MILVEMYIIIIVTLMTKVLGLPQSCLLYCKLSPDHSSIPRPECDCSLQHLQKTRSTTTKDLTPSMIKDSGIYYEPVKLNSSLDTSFDEQTFHMFNITPNISFKPNSSSNMKYNSHHKLYNSNETFGLQDIFDELDDKSSLKYKRRDSYFQKVVEETKELPLHLYLDIDLDSSDNNDRSQLEELKKMFENFQAAEKDLSECINLHIYIFSKYIDTINKTNSNWGRELEPDNLSTTQELTEIQNKCNQTASIIKQSIYQIKNSYLSNEINSELLQEHQTNHSADSTNVDNFTHHESLKPENKANTTTAMDMHTTLTTYLTDDVYNATSRTDNIAGSNLKMLDNNDVTDIKNTDFISTSPVYNYKEMNLANTTDSTTKIDNYEILRTTSKMIREVFREKEIDIPSIETKEFANGTFLSVVSKHEDIPNSDYIDDSVTSATSEESTIHNFSVNESVSDPVLLKTNIDKIVKSDLIEIHGNLYFLFGKKQIPARFVQQPDGDLNVAIDGFSMCDQIKEDNTSTFMKLLCKYLQNCTYSPV